MDRVIRRALAGLVIVPPIWAYVFQGKLGGFWARMATATGGLGLFAISSRKELRQPNLKPGDIVSGLASAGALYGLFQIGDHFARAVMPGGEQEISDIYALRTTASKPTIALLLMTVIGPGEELFWRGLVQEGLMRRFGRIKGTAGAAAAYGATHLVTRNLTLTGAAGVAGAWWGGHYALQRRLAPVLISHIVWDVWIFLLAPTHTGKRH